MLGSPLFRFPTRGPRRQQGCSRGLPSVAITAAPLIQHCCQQAAWATIASTGKHLERQEQTLGSAGITCRLAAWDRTKQADCWNSKHVCLQTMHICILEPTERGWSQSGCLPGPWSPAALLSFFADGLRGKAFTLSSLQGAQALPRVLCIFCFFGGDIGFTLGSLQGAGEAYTKVLSRGLQGLHGRRGKAITAPVQYPALAPQQWWHVLSALQ